MAPPNYRETELLIKFSGLFDITLLIKPYDFLPLLKCGSMVDLLEGAHCIVESLPPMLIRLLSTPIPGEEKLT